MFLFEWLSVGGYAVKEVNLFGLGAVESEVCGGKKVMNQESLALYQVTDFTVSNIRQRNIKNADQRDFSDALFG